MAIDWRLAGEPVSGLDALRYYGMAQQDQLQQRKLQVEERKRQALASAYDPRTGRVDDNQIRQTLINSSDIEGYRAYNKSLQGEQAESAKIIGQLALAADTPEKWDQSIDYLVQHGATDLAAYKGQFSPENRMAAMAIGGTYDDYVKSQEPKYIPVGENGVVNVRDPGALAAVAAATTGQIPPAAPPSQAPRPTADRATLERQAQEAIANGADPAAVRARLQSMLGGAGSGQRTFP